MTGNTDAADMLERRDRVIVEDLTGEEDDAVVVGLPEETAGECVLFEDDGDDVTVAQYWGGTVEENEEIVRVRYLIETDDGELQAGKNVYDFPASKVTPVNHSDDPDADDETVAGDA